MLPEASGFDVNVARPRINYFRIDLPLLSAPAASKNRVARRRVTTKNTPLAPTQKHTPALAGVISAIARRLGEVGGEASIRCSQRAVSIIKRASFIFSLLPHRRVRLTLAG